MSLSCWILKLKSCSFCPSQLTPQQQQLMHQIAAVQAQVQGNRPPMPMQGQAPALTQVAQKMAAALQQQQMQLGARSGAVPPLMSPKFPAGLAAAAAAAVGGLPPTPTAAAMAAAAAAEAAKRMPKKRKATEHANPDKVLGRGRLYKNRSSPVQCLKIRRHWLILHPLLSMAHSCNALLRFTPIILS